MPTIFVHEMNKPALRVAITGKSFRLGRDPACDLVLNGSSVSREHAEFRFDGAGGNWFIYCTSQTNPIVVDGKLVGESAWVKEGSEILIGADHLLVFSENEQKTAALAQDGRVRFAKHVCPGCDWLGMISMLRKDPPCPRCGGTGLRSADAYVKDVEAAHEAQNATFAMDLDQVRASLRQLKNAKRSHVERVDSWAEGGQRQDLVETEPVLLARDAPLKLRGFVFGRVRIAWNGRRWMATNELKFGALTVNGEPTQSTALKHGDLIEIGRNRFKLVTE